VADHPGKGIGQLTLGESADDIEHTRQTEREYDARGVMLVWFGGPVRPGVYREHPDFARSSGSR
jgi:hypothetical protein